MDRVPADRSSAPPRFLSLAFKGDTDDGNASEHGAASAPPRFLSLAFKGDTDHGKVSANKATLVETEIRQEVSNEGSPNVDGVPPQTLGSPKIAASVTDQAPSALNEEPVRDRTGSALAAAVATHVVDSIMDVVMEDLPKLAEDNAPASTYNRAQDVSFEGYDRSLLHRWRAGALLWQQPRTFANDTPVRARLRTVLVQQTEAAFEEWDRWDLMDRLETEAGLTFQDFVCRLDDVVQESRVV
ncbi:hypothetical protein FA95DRAFT_1611148 [Auriscalpium vulgare]|uniref:Uncharacterized protein n=1 Tax=Auriscalpium vulgare TaxID=40419 RepID=A0ACB8RAW2_9AGAM|nr:hypothetical protein FA95DRAFT_1611148 [Auriscalpium vulgare]